mgnify:CR=1 FL=1
MKTLSVLSVLSVIGYAAAAVPTAIFHGMGDACIHPGMHSFAKKIADETGAYAKCVEIGNGSMTSLFENFEKQAEEACEKVINDPNFQGEFNVLGLSQGGLIARHIVERCPTQGQPRNLVTLGGPNMGVAKIPNCFDGAFCNILNYIADNLVYFDVV